MDGRHAVAIALVATMTLGFVAACSGTDAKSPPTTESDTELDAPKRALVDPRQVVPVEPKAETSDPAPDDGEAGESRGNGGGGGGSGHTVPGSGRLPK